MMREHKRLESLALFAQVAETLSFTRAAERLGVSKGYLSEQVKRLERELGVALLIRSTRSVRLTEEGERIRRRMGQVRGTLVELERELEHADQGFSGELYITAPVLFTQCFLLELCHEFQAEHPELRVHLDVSYTSHDLGRDRFDLAFRSTRTPPDSMIARPLLHYRSRCCASPDYLARRGTPQRPDQLSEHDCLHYRHGDLWSFDSEQAGTDGPLVVNDHRLLKRMALEGRGIIRVADYLVAQEVAEGRLVSLLEQDADEDRTIYMIYPSTLRQSAKLSAFIALVQRRLGPA